MGQFIVVEDPKGEFWEGALVDEMNAQALRAREVVLLPVIPDLFRRSGVGGFHKRAWGSGWSVDHFSPRVICPLTMYCAQYTDENHRALSQLNWAAKIVLTDEIKARLKIGHPDLLPGFLKITSDASQFSPFKAGVVPKTDRDDRVGDRPAELLFKDLVTYKQKEDGMLVLTGKATLTIPGDGYYGFGLYAMGTGLKVVWLAVSQSLQT